MDLLRELELGGRFLGERGVVATIWFSYIHVHTYLCLFIYLIWCRVGRFYGVFLKYLNVENNYLKLVISVQ